MEAAINTAMQMESKIRDLYQEAYERCADKAGQRIFQMLRDDEQYHYDYLAKRLDEVRQSGKINLEPIHTTIPTADQIQDVLAQLKKSLAKEDRGVVQQMLSNALKAEVQTSEYYENIVSEFTGEIQKMFARFLEIEDAHVEAVQAELDYVMRTGYWFDFKEFDME